MGAQNKGFLCANRELFAGWKPFLIKFFCTSGGEIIALTINLGLGFKNIL
jgi:hypothetical protein